MFKKAVFIQGKKTIEHFMGNWLKPVTNNFFFSYKLQMSQGVVSITTVTLAASKVRVINHISKIIVNLKLP